MEIVGGFFGQIDEAEDGKNPNIFTRLMLDPGKFRKIAAATRDSGEAGNFNDRSVRIWGGSQFRTEQQPGNTHRLVDEDLFLIFAPLAPLQNRFDRNHRRLEFENALQQQSGLKRWRRILPSGFNDRDRDCLDRRL